MVIRLDLMIHITSKYTGLIDALFSLPTALLGEVSCALCVWCHCVDSVEQIESTEVKGLMWSL